MNHPSDLLADLVDGTLGADARARVEAHLSACATCREDVAAASGGREALRGLGAVPPPADLGDRIAAAAGGGGDTATGPPRWYRWAGVAAAAALVAVIAFSLPDIGDGGSADRAGGFGSVGSAVGTTSAEQGVTLEVRPDVDYRQEDLARLAADAPVPAAPEGHAVAADADEAFGTASACVTRAFAKQPSGRIVRLIRARFQGRPAYVAVYLEGPGAGQDPDTATVWVAALDDCSILSFAQARI
jgi:anti-sigma factor RsiW